MMAVIKSFEAANPGIKIDATFFNGATIGQQILTLQQAGNPPDIFQTQPASNTSPTILGNAGKLLDLSSQPWAQTPWKPGAPAVEGSNHHVYALLTSMNPSAVVYNPQIFKKVGLGIPTTLSQFLSACHKLNAAGYQPVVNGFASSVETGIVVGLMMSTEYVYSVDPSFDAQRAAGQTTFANSPLWRNVFNTVEALKQANCFGPGAAGITPDQEAAPFAEGKAAMSLLALAQLAPILAINPKVPYGAFNFPSTSAQNTAVSLAVDEAMSISASTKHPAAAEKFVSYMAGPGGKQYTSTGFSISQADAENGTLPAFAAPMEPAFKKGKIVLSTHAYPNPTLIIGNSGIAGGITGLMTGTTTVKQALANLDYLWAHRSATAAP